MFIATYFCLEFYNTFWNGKEVAFCVANMKGMVNNSERDSSYSEEWNFEEKNSI